MLAMVLREVGGPLVPERRPDPEPGPGEVRIRVEACAVCRTDLHLIDGELPQAIYPIVPGHEVVGIVEAVGEGVKEPRPGARVGVPWLGHACGHCAYCRTDRENLCDAPGFTGCTRDGGFASHLMAEAAFTIPLDASLAPVATAPLLCAGLIGWRTLRMADEAGAVGLYGLLDKGRLRVSGADRLLSIGNGRACEQRDELHCGARHLPSLRAQVRPRPARFRTGGRRWPRWPGRADRHACG